MLQPYNMRIGCNCDAISHEGLVTVKQTRLQQGRLCEAVYFLVMSTHQTSLGNDVLCSFGACALQSEASLSSCLPGVFSNLSGPVLLLLLSSASSQCHISQSVLKRYLA